MRVIARRTAVLVLPFVALLALPACDDPLRFERYEGTYHLESIDAAALPVPVTTAQGTAQILEGDLRLEAHGRYLLSLLTQLPDGSAGTLRESGEFEESPTGLRFRPDERDRSRFDGTLSGDTVVLTRDLFFDANPNSEQLKFVRGPM